MLYEDEVNLIVDVWEGIKTYVDKKERYDAAASLLRAMENYYDMDGICEELLGNDSVLDAVIKDLYGPEDIEEDDDQEDIYDSGYDQE